ncbi:MAG TPA: transglycosylase domain-containing protein [Solirubrobacteraceae bacterium]|nr:transglycosylase domain-containing protein [Solirubrobacteraceae bacterium]
MSVSDRPDIMVLPDPPLGRPRLKRLRLALILVGLSVLALVSTAFGMMMAVASDLPQLENRTEFKHAQNSLLTDVHGDYLATLADQGRIIIPAKDIALSIQHAIIAIEDKRFYENQGVDLRGTARALWQDVTSGKAVQGGSTITQQFVKNATQAQDRRTLMEKVREAALAYHLTHQWSKEKILTEYLNSIYFGNGAYGIESAARTYFGDDVNHRGCGRPERRCAKELKPHEAALLAGLVASPTAYDPVANNRAAKRRRNLVLDRMREQGYLTAAEYARGIAEPVPSSDTIRPPTAQAASQSVAYFTSWVRQQVVDRYGPREALLGGLRVQTTLDLGLQRSAELAINRWLGNPLGPQAALVAIDNDSGEIRAMVGGRDYSQVPFNLATQGQRQPGSAFKPFVLATALRRGISPSSTWTSKKQVFNVPNSIEKFTVNNYEDNYSGVSTLARATTFSDNSVYAQVGIKTGTKRIARTAERMGIRTPVSTNYAITLGGLKQGVTPLDLAHAYQTFATGGLLVSGSLGAPKRGPVGIRRVTLRDHRNRVRDRNEQRRLRVLPRNVAETTTSILESVIKVGTAKVAQLPAARAWGKTGTTENYGDAWFVGATDKLTVAVWVGYPNELRPMRTEYRGQPVAGGTYPAQIWHDFMLAALETEKRRLERSCAREQAARDTAAAKRLAENPDATPRAENGSARCIEAGLAKDPAAEATAPTTTTPAAGTATTEGDPAAPDPSGDGATEQPAPEGDGGVPATPAPDPAATPGPAPAPATPPAVTPPAPVTESGGATPTPP